MFLSTLRRLMHQASQMRTRARRTQKSNCHSLWSWRPKVEGFEDRTLLSTATWINAAGGDWNNAANWSSQRVPGPTDTAVVNLPVHITSSGIATIACPVQLVSGAVVDFIGGTNYLAKGAVITGSGLVRVSGGGTDITAPVSVSNLAVVGGAMVLDWLPGHSGDLTVTGHYTQTAAGTLVLDIASASNYGWVHVQGHATLNGTLSMNNSFPGWQIPTVGDTFKILTFGSRSGDFSTKQGLTLRNGDSLKPVYHVHDLTLDTVAPPAGPMIQGGDTGSKGASQESSQGAVLMEVGMSPPLAGLDSQPVSHQVRDDMFRVFSSHEEVSTDDVMALSLQDI